MPWQYATPVLLHPDGRAERPARLPLVASGDGTPYDEAWLESLIVRHPEILPIEEIDSTYLRPVPICTQLATRAGPLDILLATPNGRLVVVEAKLWRNPEARRKVVGQILDYAAELTRWRYDDLQREVSRRLGRQGNALYELVRERHPEVEEARFVDAVSRSLGEGRFLLLVCGDGIREGVAEIAEFLGRNTSLDLTFGLVELALFADAGGRLLVQPRTLARTVTISRQVIRVEGEGIRVSDEAGDMTSPLPGERESRIRAFWTELATRLRFDDPRQPPFKVQGRSNVTLTLPTPDAWITLYLAQRPPEAGVFFTTRRSPVGDDIFAILAEDRVAIEHDLPADAAWSTDADGKHRVLRSMRLTDPRNPEERERALEFLGESANRFVNAFRPRVTRIVESRG